MTKNEYRKGVCQCRKCHETFHQSDVKKVKTERLGLEIEENVCPYCGSNAYGLVEYPVKEEDLLYKNYYHRNTNKNLRRKLNVITNQIIAEDINKYMQNIKNKKFVKEVNNERMAMA